MRNSNVRFFSYLISVLIFSLFISCSIGLGEAVDTKGPAVTISSPEPRETVQTKFNISGTVADDYSINSLIVRIQKNEWQEGDCFEWKNTKGVWQYKARGTSEYVAFADGVWQQKNGNKNATWAVNNIDFSSMPGGSYEVVVIGSDDAGNDSADSKKIRTIIVDDMPPVITITSPSVKDDITVYSEIEDYRDITKISTFTTGDFTVSGIAKDENTIVYIDLYIKNEDSTENYFVKRLVSDTDYAEGKDYIMVDTLRAWDVDIKLKDCGLGKLDSKKHMLKIVTESCDISKNTTVTTQGFFCLWKEADTPWISLNLGTSDKPLSVYAGSSLMGNAYDDTAVDQVTVTIKENGPGGSTVSGYSGTEIYKAKEGEAENNVFFSFKVPENVNVYYVEINEKDNKGNSALAFTGYIEVVDKTYPSMEIKHKVAGEEKQVGESLFGNADGDFEFEFTAKDDTKVSSLKVVYITNPEDVVKYANKDAPEWNDESKMTNSRSELKNGKVLVFENPQQTGNVNESGIDRKVYRIPLVLNLFTDLGIDGNSRKLSNQTFVVRTEDEYHNAMTKEYTILGDINAPKVEFTKIEYNGKTITNQDDLLDAFVGECSVTVYGKIGDDSYDVWKDKGKLDFKLAANEKDVSYSLSDDGTFKAAITSREILKGASLSFKATVTDWAGLSTIGNYSFVVDTSKPRVEYFYAKQTDGCYGVREEIDIRLRFNKPLKLTGSAKPAITLNNGAVVEMDTDTSAKKFPNLYTEGEREYSFKYTVENDVAREADKLTVAVDGFNLNGCTIADGKITQDMVNELTHSGSGANLGDRKSITIIIEKPKLVLFSNFENGKIILTYSKPVEKGDGNITITQENVERVPVILSDSDYRKLSSMQKYYETGTNGIKNYETAKNTSDANKNLKFEPDLSAKHILLYKYNCDGSEDGKTEKSSLVSDYIATKNHILVQKVKSDKVKISDDGLKVTVEFDIKELPCKGATYKLEIDGGFVQDKKGKASYKTDSYIKPSAIKTSGIEVPVIRIKKMKTTVKKESGKYVATQPYQTEFKVDCETAVDSLSFSSQKYKTITKSVTNERPSGNSSGTREIFGDANTSEKKLGNNDANTGEEFQITVIAQKGTEKEYGFEVAYKTVVEVTKIHDKVTANSGDQQMTKNYDKISSNPDIYKWNYDECPDIGLFIRGGNNPTGPNTIDGYPTTWNANDLVNACLMTKDSSNNYHMVTWSVSDKYYFMFMAGLMDEKTITQIQEDPTDGIRKECSLGPKYGIFLQNSWVPNSPDYPAGAGQKVTLDAGSVAFRIDENKASKYR